MSKKKRATKKSKSFAPLLKPGKAVDWWFIFKLNPAEEEGVTKPKGMKGIFDVPGWKRPSYKAKGLDFSQRFLVASSNSPAIKHGKGILGTSVNDPLGATFDQVYNGSGYYVIWNDQFYKDPRSNAGGPYGHSKGMVAWDDDGNGFVMQVSTPSWPASGNKAFPRKTDGNTLGFIKDDDVEVSQHFFALKINKADLLNILDAMCNARIVTARTKKQVFNNGGPADVQAKVEKLGKKPKTQSCMKIKLSSGVQLISKPSRMAAPPWQVVSASLGGIDLRVVSWWKYPAIFSTKRGENIPCWDKDLPKKIGAVEIARSGKWKDETLGFDGGSGDRFNHAKFGVSTSGKKGYSIFGDMNQQGALCPNYAKVGQKCSSSQNGRGGLFYVLDDKQLFKSLTELVAGNSAEVRPAVGKIGTSRKKISKTKAKRRVKNR